jgi:hypothetical protein
MGGRGQGPRIAGGGARAAPSGPWRRCRPAPAPRRSGTLRAGGQGEAGSAAGQSRTGPRPPRRRGGPAGRGAGAGQRPGVRPAARRTQDGGGVDGSGGTDTTVGGHAALRGRKRARARQRRPRVRAGRRAGRAGGRAPGRAAPSADGESFRQGTAGRPWTSATWASSCRPSCRPWCPWHPCRTGPWHPFQTWLLARGERRGMGGGAGLCWPDRVQNLPEPATTVRFGRRRPAAAALSLRAS